MTTKMLRNYLPLIVLICLFTSFKLSSLGIRLSDTNIYFYTAQELLRGKILYKDIFFTNFPLIPYSAALYSLISGGSLLFYYFTAVIEASLTACVLYWIGLEQTNSRLTAFFASFLYLFSFMILATTDHQTGVFLASLFGTLSFAFFSKKHFLLTGIFTALALLTKAYSLPILLSFTIYLLLTNRRALLPFIGGNVIAGVVVILPSLLLAPTALWHDVFMYSLTRSQGLSKAGILWFILQHDFLPLLLLGSTVVYIKKYLLLGLVALFSLLFFILYKDTYYLYLNVCLPFACIALFFIGHDLIKKFSLQRLMIPTIIVLFTLYNFITYIQGFQTLQRIDDFSSMVTLIEKTKPPVLYGINVLTPALAHFSQRPLLDNIVDTNDNIFRKGYLNADMLTKESIAQHALVITQGAWYPDENITEDVLTEIINPDLLKRKCTLLKRYPVTTESYINSLNFFRC